MYTFCNSLLWGLKVCKKINRKWAHYSGKTSCVICLSTSNVKHVLVWNMYVYLNLTNKSIVFHTYLQYENKWWYLIHVSTYIVVTKGRLCRMLGPEKRVLFFLYDVVITLNSCFPFLTHLFSMTNQNRTSLTKNCYKCMMNTVTAYACM